MTTSLRGLGELKKKKKKCIITGDSQPSKNFNISVLVYCKFFTIPLSHNSQKRLEHKENQIKYQI